MGSGTDRPGKEIPKEYREVVAHQIDRFGWRYDASRKGHPLLYPADRSMRAISVPTTPTKGPRGLRNFVARVRQAGGEWPPNQRRRS